jgi:adenylosuccinate lyase
MRGNLDATGGLVYSGAVLLALVEAGLTRERAYASVQRAAARTWEDQTPFRETLLAEPDVAAALGGAQLDAIMEPHRYLAHAGAIFKRVEAIDVSGSSR